MSDNKYNNVMHLGNPTNTIAVLNRYGFDFKKKFGQNFLIDENVVEKIVREEGAIPATTAIIGGKHALAAAEDLSLIHI